MFVSLFIAFAGTALIVLLPMCLPLPKPLTHRRAPIPLGSDVAPRRSGFLP
ncbi:MAG: hypothetical protein AAFY65_09390 [Pseudomonadota bacterium]